MAKIDSSINRVQFLIGNHSIATRDLCLSFFNTRHASLLDSYDWSRKKGEIAITAVPEKSNGTLTVMNGSNVVNGTSTSFTASDVDSYVRIGGDDDSLYVVGAVNHSAQFTLVDLNGAPLPFPGSSASGQSYVMFKRFYTLPLGIEMLFEIKGETPLVKKTYEFIDAEDPTRTSTTDSPLCWAPVERDRRNGQDLMRIEIWPRPTSAKIYTASAQFGHVDLQVNQHPIVPSEILEWYAAADVCFALAARTKDVTWIPLATKYIEQGDIAKELQLGKDRDKFGTISAVQDVHSGIPLGLTDFALNHDSGDW